MKIRAFEPRDARDLATLSEACARGEGDFVLNPLWETEAELFVEFERRGIAPEDHLLVADAEEEGILGFAGFLRFPQEAAARLCCPIVRREQRGRGVGGQLLRAVLALGRDRLGIQLATAAVGTRNRAGYALLTAVGFRPMRQVFLMRCDLRPQVEKLPIPGLELDRARDDDADAIAALYRSCGFPPRDDDSTLSMLRDGRHDIWVARDAQGGVVAFAELETHWPARPWVSFVGVQAELRDRGLGSTLVALALAHRFDAGARAALLTMSPANRTAVRAYEKVGFRRWRLLDVLERPL